jgi:dUTP pyrophosphatase
MITVRYRGQRPEQAYGTSVGWDLRATEGLTLEAGCWGTVPTGLWIELLPGCEGQIRPRSGFALTHGVTVLNAPGTIDANYRGEIKVLLINHSKAPVFIAPGQRVAQLVIAPAPLVRWEEVDELSLTLRGERGFGSSGSD